MENKDTDQLHEELNTINAVLKQIRDGLDSVKTEVQAIHALVKDLPSGEKWVATGVDRVRQ